MKKIVALVLAVMLLLSAASALAEFDQKVSFTVCTSQTQAAGDYNSDKLAKYVQEKFNVDYEVWPIAYDSQNEKVRVWVNSESMPSLTAWMDWNISEYSEYVDQGLLGALPEGWEQDYPNLHRMIEKTGLLDKLTIDGKLYAVPNAVFGVFLDMDPITNHSTTWYRADWAEQLGYHFGDTATFAEFRKYLEDCIANNMSGMDATYGLVGTSDYVNSFFFDATGVDYDGFMETEDGMVWGPTLEAIPETIKMIRDWYQSGLIYPDYYLLSSTDAPEYFYVGNCAALRKDGPVSSHVGVADGLEENGIDPSVAKPIMLTGEDGVVHAQETTNYWTVIIFNPENDAETMARLCSMIDWLYSEEGILCCQMGVPGVEWDYDAEGKPYYLDAAIGEDGFYASGDLCVADGKGNIKITGRKKEILVRGGENLSLHRIEDALEGCGAVADCAVSGWPDERLGERICAYIVPRSGTEGLTLSKLQADLRARGVPKYLWPERIELREKIPRTPTGKVQRYLLR